MPSHVLDENVVTVIGSQLGKKKIQAQRIRTESLGSSHYRLNVKAFTAVSRCANVPFGRWALARLCLRIIKIASQSPCAPEPRGGFASSAS